MAGGVALVCGLFGLVIGALWFLMARDEPEHHPWVSPEELSYISAGLPHGQICEGRLCPGDHPRQQECLDRHGQLLRFLLCRLHLLHLVLHLSEHSPRPESEGERWLFHASVRGHGALLFAGGLDQRSPDAALWKAGWTLSFRRRGRWFLPRFSLGWGPLSAMPGWLASFSREERALCIWRKVHSGRSVRILAAVRRAPSPE